MILFKNILFLTLITVSTVSAKSIIQQLLNWDFADTKVESEQRQAEEPISNCICDGPGCICCSDFNLTYIDLGGPGCVRLKYISPEEGMAVNVSYGDSLIHSEVVKGPNPEPTCIDLLTDLAQVCARFTEISPTSDGVRGCLKLEPRILGEAQSEYEMGCFRVGPQGMVFDPPANNTKPNGEGSTKPSQGEEISEEEEGEDSSLSEEQIVAAVSQTAEQGLAFLTSLFNIDLASIAAELSDNSTDTTTTSSNTITTTLAPPNNPDDTPKKGKAYNFNPKINQIL